jgi:hypothetical protein
MVGKSVLASIPSLGEEGARPFVLLGVDAAGAWLRIPKRSSDSDLPERIIAEADGTPVFVPFGQIQYMFEAPQPPKPTEAELAEMKVAMEKATESAKVGEVSVGKSSADSLEPVGHNEQGARTRGGRLGSSRAKKVGGSSVRGSSKGPLPDPSELGTGTNKSARTKEPGA